MPEQEKWRLAESLRQLRAEIDAFAPKRRKALDGTIGDVMHQARGSDSDHNPWIKDANGVGVVRALDITSDPRRGVPGSGLAEGLCGWAMGAGDRRISYVIWKRRIASAASGWEWRPYTGEDPHDKHVHISVSREPDLFDLTSGWHVSGWLRQPSVWERLRAKIAYGPMFPGLKRIINRVREGNAKRDRRKTVENRWKQIRRTAREACANPDSFGRRARLGKVSGAALPVEDFRRLRYRDYGMFYPGPPQGESARAYCERQIVAWLSEGTPASAYQIYLHACYAHRDYREWENATRDSASETSSHTLHQEADEDSTSSTERPQLDISDGEAMRQLRGIADGTRGFD